MTAGESRKAECPQPPDNSSSIHEDPADAVPYIGSLRASDWSLHGSLLVVAVIRGRRHHDGLSQKSADQHRRVGTVEAGQGIRIGDEPAVKRRDRVCTRRRKRHHLVG